MQDHHRYGGHYTSAQTCRRRLRLYQYEIAFGHESESKSVYLFAYFNESLGFRFQSKNKYLKRLPISQADDLSPALTVCCYCASVFSAFRSASSPLFTYTT